MKKLIPILMFTLCMLMLLACANCGAVKEEARATAQTAIDCTKAEAAAAIATYAPTLEQVLLDNAGADGRIDRERVKAAVRGYATNAAKCVIASTLARLLAPPASSPGAPQASPLELNAEDLDGLRVELLGGVEYKLPSSS